jgi:hypothetical protein
MRPPQTPQAHMETSLGQHHVGIHKKTILDEQEAKLTDMCVTHLPVLTRQCLTIPQREWKEKFLLRSV